MGIKTGIVICTAVLGVSSANAAEHLLHVSEVQVANGAGSDTVQFVEFTDPGETFPNNPYKLKVYRKNGTVMEQDVTIPRNMTIFVVGKGGITSDAVLTLDLPREGEVCFERSAGTKVHCLAYGCVTPSPGAAHGPAPGDGESVGRQPANTATVGSPTPGNGTNTVGTVEVACPGADAGPVTGTPDAAPGTTPDANTTAGGTDAGSGGSNGGGCAVAPGQSGGAMTSLLGLIALVTIRRRRR